MIAVPELRAVETEFFRMLNRIIEPRVRAGLGSPCLAPGGVIVLETIGRRSGRRARLPLAATRIQGHLIVGTFRAARSQWVRNLAAVPDVRVWLGGRPRAMRAYVISAASRRKPPRSFPAVLRWTAAFLRPYTQAGWAFAILAEHQQTVVDATRVPSKGMMTPTRRRSAR